MGKRKIRVMLCVLLSAITAVLMLSVSASADSGPKPSINVIIKNVGSETCYATMISDRSYGFKYISLNGSENGVTDVIMDNWGSYGKEGFIINDPIYDIFSAYAEKDSFEYSAWYAKLGMGANEIEWSYRSPDHFKLVLYYPDSDRFEESQVCDCFAYNSTFIAELSDSGEITAVWEDDNIIYRILSILVLIVVNLLIELGLALLFKFRKKFHIITIIITNLITQGSLFIWLNFRILTHGAGIFEMFGYLIAEVVILVVEMTAYSIIFRKDERRKYVQLYAFLANLASFLVGSPVAWFIISLVNGIRRNINV